MLNTADNRFNDTDLIHCNALNAAFYELGLNWYWDLDTYRKLLAESAELKECIRIYLETRQPHLLKAYDAAFLISAIESTKERCYEAMSAAGQSKASQVNWAQIQMSQIGI